VVPALIGASGRSLADAIAHGYQPATIVMSAVTPEKMAEIFSRVTGREVRFNEMPIEQSRLRPNLATLSEWLNAHDFGGNLADLRKIKPGVLTLEAWMMRSGWDQAAKEAVASASAPA
jgi:hypothetical protein